MYNKNSQQMNDYCRMGNFRLEGIFAIFVRQATLPRFNIERQSCDVFK